MHGAQSINCGPWGHFHEHSPRLEHRRRKLAAIAAMQSGEGDRPQRGRRGHDGGPFGTGFGPGGFGGFGRGRQRARRGDVRAAILVLLEEEPRNGYQLMQEIEQRSDGDWRPSPGSVYPALAQLEDEQLVAAQESESGRHFALTDDGRRHVDENREKLGEPWANLGGDVGDGLRSLRDQIKPLMAAVGQLMHNGSDEDAKRASEILANARRGIYGILAGDDTATDDDSM